ncbi:MAG: hypothetical protein V1773_14855 [bacterium]
MTEIFHNIVKAINENPLTLGIVTGIITVIATPIIYYYSKKLTGFSKRIVKNTHNKFRSKESLFDSIQIEGATVISKSFLSDTLSIGKKKKYKESDFYLAKKNETCQWYGILNKLDIERDAYIKIKKEIDKAFADEYREPKIIALIHGRGGSGKSTLMRRLAVVCSEENICVLWLNVKEISKFYEKGINQLNDFTEIMFLIFIEDWYKMNPDKEKINPENAKNIIDSICNYPNVRVIIGDRTIDNSISTEHIYNPDENIIELLASENKKTITKILEKISRWKATADLLLTEESDYKSSLYLILWVIARTYQSKNKIDDEYAIQYEGLTGHFLTIVESDLKAIAKQYLGLAKMLYYYGSVYSESRLLISFDIFIKLCDLFEERGESSKFAFASKEIKPILDIYMNQTTGAIKSAGQLLLVAFNHDILADEGLSKLKINGWYKFDDSIKLKMLPMFINEGENFSASSYLEYTFRTVDKENISNQERLNYIKILFKKGNRGSYLKYLFNGLIEIDEEEKNTYAIAILDNFLENEYSKDVICLCLNQIQFLPEGRKAVTYILSQPDFLKLSQGIVVTAIKLSKSEEEQQRAVSFILARPDFFKLPQDIVSTAMKIFKNENKRQAAATIILSQPNLFKLTSAIVSTAMNISKHEDERQKAASFILSKPDFFKSTHDFVSKALKISKDEKKRQVASSIILSQPDILKLSPDIVSIAMNISKNENERQAAASTILSQPDIFKLPPDLVSVAMKISKNENQRQVASTIILSKPDLFELSNQLVTMALRISSNDIEKQKVAILILSQQDFFKLNRDIVSQAIKISKDVNKATYILNNWEFIDWRIVFQSFFCFTDATTYPKFIIDIVTLIINSKNKGGKQYFHFSQILKIPLHGIQLWHSECNNIINNYKHSNASLINNVLYSHRLYPQKVFKLCEAILIHWETEIVKPIKQINNDIHYGDNIKIAFSHPNLKKLVKQTAKKMLLSESKKSGSIPNDLLEIVHQIIDENKCPEWNTELDY